MCNYSVDCDVLHRYWLSPTHNPLTHTHTPPPPTYTYTHTPHTAPPHTHTPHTATPPTAPQVWLTRCRPATSPAPHGSRHRTQGSPLQPPHFFSHECPELVFWGEGLQKGHGYLFVPVLGRTDVILQKLGFDLKAQVTQQGFICLLQ